MLAVESFGLFDQMRHELSDTVVGHAAVHCHAGGRHVGKLQRVVGLGENSFGEVFAYLVLVDVESGDHFDVFNAIITDLGVHHSRNVDILRQFHVMIYSLYQRGSAVPNPNDSYLDLPHRIGSFFA